MAQSLASQRFNTRRALNFSGNGNAAGQPTGNQAATGAANGLSAQTFSPGAGGAPPPGGASGNTAYGGQPNPYGGFQNAGQIMSAFGTAGTALGLPPGLGLAGNVIGNTLEAGEINAALSKSNMDPLSFGQVLSAIGNTATVGLLGTPLGDSMVANATKGVSSSGVPGEDPEDIATAQSRSYAPPTLAAAPAAPVASAPATADFNPDADRMVDREGNPMMGTSKADNSPGSINGYGGSEKGAFGNYPTFQSFFDTLNGAPPPWSGGAKPTGGKPEGFDFDGLIDSLTSQPTGGATPPSGPTATGPELADYNDSTNANPTSPTTPESPTNDGDGVTEGDGTQGGETSGGGETATGGGGSVGGDVGGGSGEVSGEGAPGGYRVGGLIPDDGDGKLEAVPVTAHEKEFVMRPEAVQMYGADVMRALNKGLVKPETLRRLFGR